MWTMFSNLKGYLGVMWWMRSNVEGYLEVMWRVIISNVERYLQ